MCASGLLGGAVYVNTFTLLSASRQLSAKQMELALAAATVADSAGIALADAAGIIIQVRLQHQRSTVLQILCEVELSRVAADLCWADAGSSLY